MTPLGLIAVSTTQRMAEGELSEAGSVGMVKSQMVSMDAFIITTISQERILSTVMSWLELRTWSALVETGNARIGTTGAIIVMTRMINSSGNTFARTAYLTAKCSAKKEAVIALYHQVTVKHVEYHRKHVWRFESV